MTDYKDISPNRSTFWLAAKWIAFAVALIVVLRFLIMPLFVAEKIVGREVKKFDAETAAQVYDNSRQYQQGINRDIARYCREYDAAPDGSKRAIADLINSTLDTYQGELTPANSACAARIGE